ncbi:MAG: tetratricopeptide repeat protein [bacterium]|nr:tetratricopeptide repeat protein [bacterium]
MRLYICYAHADRSVVRKLAELARFDGYDPIFEQVLQEDLTWPEQIAQSIATCDTFLYAISRKSLADDWCQWELSLAISYTRPLLPVLLQAEAPLPLIFSRYPYVDFTDSETDDGSARLLVGLKSVRVLVPKEDAPEAPLTPAGLPSHVASPYSRIEAAVTQPSRATLAKAFYERARNRPSHELDEKIADYSEAIQQNPDFAEAYVRRGANRSIKGDADGAMADYNMAIQIDPTLAYAFLNRGIAHEEREAFEHALRDYDQALTLNPDYADAYNSRGNLHYNQGRFEAAIADYDRIIELNPKQAYAYYNRGNAREKQGDLRGAINDWSRYLHLGGASEQADPFIVEKRISDAKKKLQSMLQ